MPGPDSDDVSRANRRHRQRRIRRRRSVVVVALLIVATVVAYGLHPEAFTRRVDATLSLVAPRTSSPQGTVTTGSARSAIPTPGASSSATTSAEGPAAPTPSKTSGLPLRPAMLAKVPAGSRQALVVEGAGPSSSLAMIRYYERPGTEWVEVASWKGHVGKAGWAVKHREGDLKTPVGVFTLSDAGGRLADPGTKLSYHRSSAFRAVDSGPGFGDSAADAFDYVIAIDYNRVRGRSPLDWERPSGVARGGGIWVHVDHDGPTHGCVTIPKSAVRYLLGRLQPGHHPVVVMGPSQSL